MQNRQINAVNKHCLNIFFNDGNQILLNIKNLTLLCLNKKLNEKYVELFLIFKKKRKTVYKLKLPLNMKIHLIFYINFLELYHENE